LLKSLLNKDIYKELSLPLGIILLSQNKNFYKWLLYNAMLLRETRPN